ncbi:MAG: ATP-binding protein [Spirochaetes bacterium]|nr:ATP-binding protein [Spirochaetota bacterium]
MIDPRTSVVEKRLKNVKRIIVVSSGKGGVGKSVFSSVAALLSAEKGLKTGLLDLDFQGSSDHIILGEKVSLPEESEGICPLRLSSGIDFVSFSLFTGESPLPLRGKDTTNAILELLAVTIWKELDFLIVDLPPGIGEEILDIIRFIQRKEFIIVSSSSLVSVQVVERLVNLLQSMNLPVTGIVENMAMDSVHHVSDMSEKYGLPLLGTIPYFPELESEIGDSKKLLKGNFAKYLNAVVKNMFKTK